MTTEKPGNHALGAVAIAAALACVLIAPVAYFAFQMWAFDEALRMQETTVWKDGDFLTQRTSPKQPAPLGSTVATKTWEVTLERVDLDATDRIREHNPSTPPPGDNKVYVVAHTMVTYKKGKFGDPVPNPMIWLHSPGGSIAMRPDSAVDVPGKLDSAPFSRNESRSAVFVFRFPAEAVDDAVFEINPEYNSFTQYVAAR